MKREIALTSIPSTSNDEDLEEYPTDWRRIDEDTLVDCRRLSLDTYQLRSATHAVTIDKVGFNKYREGPEVFANWCRDNQVYSNPRSDLDGK